MSRVLCRIEEIPQGGARECRLDEGDRPLFLVLIRQGDAVQAYLNACPHAGRPLNWAPDQFLFTPSGQLVCAAHGATFEVTSGECVLGPCLGARLTRYPVRLEAGQVMADG